MSQTMQNLADAFAGESQAHTKYRYFAKIAREEGNEEIAKHFEHTASQEILHAWGHLELLIKKPTTKECLQLAIDGETYEFETMYPNFKETAEFEGDLVFANEANMQIQESKERFIYVKSNIVLCYYYHDEHKTKNTEISNSK